MAGRVAMEESSGSVVSYAAPVLARIFSVRGSVGDIEVTGSAVAKDFFTVEVTVMKRVFRTLPTYEGEI